MSEEHFTESSAQPINHGSSSVPYPSISNHSTNLNAHYGSGNIFNYNPVINSVFNSTVLEELDYIQAKIAAALKERHVPQAVCSAQPGSGCMHGTRVQVLRDVETWICDPEAPQIFWLTGMMGTGKTAIAKTVCSSVSARPDMILGGSFFCSRSAGTATQRDVRCIIPTLVQLFARQSVEFSRAVATELARDPDILHQQLAVQIEHLLYKPLLALGESHVPIVFVFDALDECGGLSNADGASDDVETHRLISDMLEALVTFSCSSVKLPVKFFVTSRPETHIRDTPVADAAFSKVLQLHTVNKQQVTADIQLYISTKLLSSSKLRAQFTGDEATVLARLSDGLFIVATTAIQFALGAGFDRAAMRFKRLLTSTGDSLSTGAAAPLDRMYALILAEAARIDETETDEELPSLLQMLASILCARMTLSVAALADLLNLPASHLRGSLSHLHAVVNVPDDNNEPSLRTLHASFGDYLFGRAPSNSRIAASVGHDILARACLDVMTRRLHFNVSRSHSSYKQNMSMTPGSVTLSLEYACMQWVYHVCDLPEASALAIEEGIHAIFLPRFLFWLEVLSVLKRVSRAAAMLIVATSVFKHAALARFLRDGVTFVASSREAIEKSAPHIYVSALPFAAKDSLIYQTFRSMCRGLISVETLGIDLHGGRLVTTLTGHEGAVHSIAYSSDGRLLASGSADGTIRVWDTRMGEEMMAPLCSGDGPVQSVVFAPGSRSLASGTNSGYVCVWNIAAGQVIPKRLGGHSGGVNSVAFAPDGLTIGSASGDGTVRLWKVETCEQIARRAHAGGVTSVKFSPDGTILASGSDRSVSDFLDFDSLSDLTSPLLFSYVPLVSAPGSSLLGSASPFDTLSVPFVPSDSASVSVPDSDNSGSLPSSGGFSFRCCHSYYGGFDRPVVRLWHSGTGEPINQQLQLEESRVSVYSICFSPDGTQIALGGNGTILLYETRTGRRIAGWATQSGRVRSIQFSPDVFLWRREARVEPGEV